MATNPKQLWLHLQNQLPDWIRHDTAYTQLVTFLNLYYEWLQTTGQPAQAIADTEANLNIDDTIDAFVKYFAAEYIGDFPLLYDPDETDPTTKAHKRQQIKRLIKHADELYISKGIDDSFRMLFRVLYGTEIELFYPKTVILKPSDGHWIEPVTLKITVDSGDIDAFDLTYGSALVTESVDGTTSFLTGASATVESITNFGSYYELHLTKGSIVSSTKAYQASSGYLYPFAPANKVRITSGSGTVIGTILPVASFWTMKERALQEGTWQVGDILYACHGTYPNRVYNLGVSFRVRSIDENGKVKALDVVDSGTDLSAIDTYIAAPSPHPSAGRVVVGSESDLPTTLTRGGLTYYPGEWAVVDGAYPSFLSDQIKIRGPLSIKSQPNGHSAAEYYQEFSYVLKTPVTPNLWRGTVKGLMHPAGYEVFGDMLFWPTSAGGRELLGMFDRNTDDVNDLDVYFDTMYHQILVTPFSTEFVVYTDSEGANKLGPSYQSFNRFMMTWPPYAAGHTLYGAYVPTSTDDFDSEWPGGVIEVRAWSADALAVNVIRDYANMVVGDFYNGNAWVKKSNVGIQAYVLIN